MSAKEKLWLVIQPPPVVGKADTSLRFTDILFGFVIKEIFIRLAHWPELSSPVRCHLVATSALVLGSWIGYRRSANRSAYEVKFINLPFVRFFVDQLMLIMYFRLAVLTPVDPKSTQPLLDDATSHTLEGILIVSGLYIVWDLLGIWMAASKKNGSAYRYPTIDEKTREPTEKPHLQDWHGFLISLILMLTLAILQCYAKHGSATLFPLIAATGLLIMYRIWKEIRTSWRPLEPAR